MRPQQSRVDVRASSGEVQRLTIMLLTAFAVCPALSSAQPTDNRLAVSPTVGRFTPAIALGQQRERVVVLKLAGDPVAVVRSRMPGKEISETDRQTIETNLRAQQQPIIAAAEAEGAKVLTTFQHAINGVKIRATPDQISHLATLPGIVAVKPVATYHLDNAQSVPFIGAPSAWQGPPGLHGEHIKVAHFDTGIDFTHANFGGPGTAAAFASAAAASTAPADPALFGPNAPKVKGGTDLVGDNYDASSKDPAKNTPMPDPNPLDCNGHGSHTAGTIAGFGVTAAGATFTGPYDAATPGVSFTVGPGVAPLADLYEVRVFGCTGSTDVVVEAIDWAIQHGMQVISMSLGAAFGGEDVADAEASENAVNAGIVVVASAGNAGPAAYIGGSPASGEKVIAVAAIDSHQFLVNGVHIALSTGGGADGVDADPAAPLPSGPVPAVILTNAGSLALGCSSADYPSSGAAGALVIVARGSCTFVTKATLAAGAGAVAIGVVNNTSGFFNPAIPGVTIPFIELQQSDSATFTSVPSPVHASIAFANVHNAGFRAFAGFSSGGPRIGDGQLKPDISAPGVSVFSTAVGTGNQGEFISGTSQAAPHVAGSAALAIQAHPRWSADAVAVGLVNTADATQLNGYSARRGGNGLVQPAAAASSSVIARTESGLPSVSFGVVESTADVSRDGGFLVENRGSSPATFAVSIVKGAGSPHTISVSPMQVTVSAGGSAGLHLSVSVPVATVGDSSLFRQVSGRIVLTPTSGNAGVTLSVPYYLVARARSIVQARTQEDFLTGHATTAAVQLTNSSGSVAGSADFYAWGLRGTHANLGSLGVRSVGVQSFDNGPPFGQLMVFAVNTFGAWSNAATNEYDILVDVNGDGKPDFDVIAVDLGAVTGAGFSGQVAVVVLNLATNAASLEPLLAYAPTDANTLLVPVVAGDVGITASNPRLSYVIQSFDNVGSQPGDALLTPARFNAFNNAISTAAFATLTPRATAAVPITIDRAEFRKTPALGVMVVSTENTTGGSRQALLLPIGGD
ncbi:MAG: peptidase S8 and S53 subtilisin kexin sedolisin [Gammaproteobacteria bacterium]|nr:MAG: peptidase S8 and S53 subtilisin kexin sedolisin [Gammaproteobacteria bacterium]